MGELRVFDMEGKAAYPPDADNDGGMSSYFSRRVFALQSGEDDGGPIVEAYFSARTARGKPNNYSLRYYGDSPETLFRDCREAVQRELVDGLGWTIERPRNGPGTSPMSSGIWPAEAGGTRISCSVSSAWTRTSSGFYVTCRRTTTHRWFESWPRDTVRSPVPSRRF